jgi:hypothetical protein
VQTYVLADPVSADTDFEECIPEAITDGSALSVFLRGQPQHRSGGVERIELSRVFRTSPRYALRKSWLSGGLFVAVFAIYLISEGGWLSDIGGYQGSMVHHAEKALVWVHLLFLIGEISFWEWYRRRVRFFIRDGRFHVRRGVFRRLESSAPLVGVTEFFIAQSSSDAVLGLYSLHIMTPLGPANGIPRFTRIDGLSRNSAEGLLEWLARYVRDSEEGEEPSSTGRPDPSAPRGARTSQPVRSPSR